MVLFFPEKGFILGEKVINTDDKNSKKRVTLYERNF